ncbi:hypothetical protein LTH96_04920 [Nesterenkonia sp. LB17]|uniref:hypothetical protein n=1 Tax=unclassified Nesterenkonia TaxID=2629769 RepID=UPI001F4CF186|nr:MULTISPECIES: hypothetical protein [unclassified Nesterenkonia]MCH8563106.1 hypothetical protein [Nesterenkonia sp. YGD6]MCH8565078.1 hypothetical protein [Nesterenkonia sp. LB17]MCH8571540.1 hypothetical protein [Nesterenkonia sp. AY15]
MELFAIILWVLAAVLFTASFDMLRRVNPDSRLPFFFGKPPINPPQVAVVRLLAFVCFLASAWIFSDVYGRSAGPILILLGTLPGCLRNLLHNRRVTAAAAEGAS